MSTSNIPSSPSTQGLPGNLNTSGNLDIVIFGGAGDLAFRKLIPSLYMAFVHDRLPKRLRIVGIGRQDWGRDQYLQFLEEKSKGFISPAALSAKEWAAFFECLDFVSMNVTDPAHYRRLKEGMANGADRVFYLATAPTLFEEILKNLSSHGLIQDTDRVVLEKPLGNSLESAKAINGAVGRMLREDQTYRIDHYLGKETVQNLMVLRFGNAVFEPLWRAPSIRSVQITVAETVGVGSRAGFYDQTGALRDMVQNHLLQLLAIVAMEPPISLNADDIRDEKLKVLRCLRPMSLEDVRRDTVRGQYTAGNCQSERVAGYTAEPDVPAGSRTETFVAIKAYVDNARWANVPFFLRTGKRMQSRQSEIIIEFAAPPFSVFGRNAQPHANRLVIGLQPEEFIRLGMNVKEPGSGMNLHPVHLGLDLQESSDKRRAEAYERLLVDVVKGRLTHFMRRDELEAAWAWCDTILAGWSAAGESPKPYPAGSWGPAAASALIAREGLSWFEEA